MQLNAFHQRLFRRWRGEAAALPNYYRHVFRPDSTMATAVLADIADFCNAGSSSFQPGDPYVTAFNEGKRAAWLHIAENLDEDSRDLEMLWARINRNHSEDDDA